MRLFVRWDLRMSSSSSAIDKLVDTRSLNTHPTTTKAKTKKPELIATDVTAVYCVWGEGKLASIFMP